MKLKVTLYETGRRHLASKSVDITAEDWHEKYLSLIAWAKKASNRMGARDQCWLLDGQRFRTLGPCKQCGRLQTSLGYSVPEYCSTACVEQARQTPPDQAD